MDRDKEVNKLMSAKEIAHHLKSAEHADKVNAFWLNGAPNPPRGLLATRNQ